MQSGETPSDMEKSDLFTCAKPALLPFAQENNGLHTFCAACGLNDTHKCRNTTTPPSKSEKEVQGLLIHNSVKRKKELRKHRMIPVSIFKHVKYFSRTDGFS